MQTIEARIRQSRAGRESRHTNTVLAGSHFSSDAVSWDICMAPSPICPSRGESATSSLRQAGPDPTTFCPSLAGSQSPCGRPPRWPT
jgi:hypothetical protein